MTRFATSVTELGNFRSCKRKWHLQAHQRLKSRNQIAWELEFGSAIHEALDAYYRFSRKVSDAHTAFDVYWDAFDTRLEKEYHFAYAQAEEQWVEMQELGRGMLTNYDIFDKTHPFFDEVIEVDFSVEERTFVDVVHPRTREALGAMLSGKIDLVVRKGKHIWIWDHKSFGRRPSSAALDIDDQLTGYCYLYWRLTGVLPRGALYNILLKQLPTEPKVNKDGSLYQNKQQRVTYDVYMAKLEEEGISDYTPYDEYLKQLKKRGWGEFFIREGAPRTLKQLKSFERHLAYTIDDMQVGLEDEETLYPNPSHWTCRTCGVLPICRAMEEGRGVADVTKSQFVVQEPRYEVPEEAVA